MKVSYMQSQEAIARSIAERAERHRRAMEKLVQLQP